MGTLMFQMGEPFLIKNGYRFITITMEGVQNTTLPLTRDEAEMTVLDAVVILFNRFFGKTGKYLIFSGIPYVLVWKLEEYIFKYASPEFQEKWKKISKYNLPAVAAIIGASAVIIFPDGTWAIISSGIEGAGDLYNFVKKLYLKYKAKRLKEKFDENIGDWDHDPDPKAWGVSRDVPLEMPEGNGGRLHNSISPKALDEFPRGDGGLIARIRCRLFQRRHLRDIPEMPGGNGGRLHGISRKALPLDYQAGVPRVDYQPGVPMIDYQPEVPRVDYQPEVPMIDYQPKGGNN